MSASTDLLLAVRAIRAAKRHLSNARTRLRAGPVDTALLELAPVLLTIERSILRHVDTVESPPLQQAPLFLPDDSKSPQPTSEAAQ